ncbi:MAG: glycoside hydrolase 43 family protein [Bacteroides sp.]
MGAQTSRDLGNGTFQNPVLWADVPDACVIRVDDTFYMVSTTMHFSPGCTIMKSKDLVNWSVAGYAHDQLEETDAFALKNGQNDYAKGSWAANLRYDKYEGRFYLIVSCNTTQKSYIFTTTDIERGLWHRNVVDMCYDPGLLFEDTGRECKKYVVHPNYSLQEHQAYLCEIFSDGKGGVKLGERKKILDYTQADNPSRGLRAEGYHGYKIGDYYYIFMIQGCGRQRQQIVWRSKSLFNDVWEVRKVFAGDMVNSDGTPFQQNNGVAQGNIVDTPDGKWYALFFQDQGAVGRMPVLLNMRWDDEGWPIIGNEGKSVDVVQPMPVTVQDDGRKGSRPSIVVSDEFDNGDPQNRYLISDKYAESLGRGGEYDLTPSVLKLEWQWNHNPDNRYWSLTDRKGWLRLKGGHLAHHIRDARNTLTQRTFGPTCQATALLDTRGMKEGDCAGLTVFQNRYGYVGVEVIEGTKYIVMRRATEKGDAAGAIIEKKALKGSKVYLQLKCDFTDRKDKACFAYSLNGKTWQTIGDELSMYFDWPDFCGNRMGLFYFPTQETGGYADFDYFRVQ